MSWLVRVATILAGLCVSITGSAETVTLVGYIGSHKLTFQAQAVAKEAKFTIKGPADYLAITEVYPDSTEPVVYKYRISGSGIGSFERCHVSKGFGPVTYFLRVRNAPLGTIKISNHSNGSKAQPVLIQSVRPIRYSELKSLLEWDRFTIFGLIPNGNVEDRESWLGLLAKDLPSRPEDHIGIGFSSEIYYANCDRASVREQLAVCEALARKYKMPAMLGLVSWWTGTPVEVEDGQGVVLGDVKYQQVYYSPDAEVSENTLLKALLGDRYDRRYGLCTPNQWSNRFWLTMNSPVLNEYRFKRLDEAIEELKAVSRGDAAWIKALFVEKEPRYWDSNCDIGNMAFARKTMWADFNPFVILDAAKDGVDLNPKDGLSKEELVWLYRNVSRYVQNTVDAVNKARASHRFAQNVPLYTHSVRGQSVFPSGMINRCASEWAYAKGARSGITAKDLQPSDLWRLREWGPWSNINREENDGRHIDEHLWDLRVAYMLGADLYNSSNWQAFGAQKFFEYLKEFVTKFPVVSLPPAEARFIDRGSIKIKTPMKLQAFSRLEVQVKVTKKITGAAFLGIVFEDGRCFSSQQQPISLQPGIRMLGIDFPTPAEIPDGKEALLALCVFDSNGRLAPDAVVLTPESAKSIKLILDLRTQRALSLSIINSNRTKQ
ncbi:MAG: hypothetical protein N3B12_07405 [Armatimonadetes bacterium]|nr:hypothetical protein [Armatimonadota bacterium]